MSEVIINPEFQSLISPLSDEELSGLQESVISEGCRDSLIIWRETGILLDGHNRYKICIENNIPFKLHEISFSDEIDAKLWVYKNQLGKRNLTPYQRGEIALKMKPLIAAKAKENLKLSEGQGIKGSQISVDLKVDTQKELARIAGVSHDTIAKIEMIEQEGDDGLKELVKSGELSINAAATTIKTEKKAAEQRKKAKQNVMSSESNEHLTPSDLLFDVVECLGDIDLDPCSNSHESPNVPAKYHFTSEDDGLTKTWFGKIFMNPPYGDEIKNWANKLDEEITAHHLEEAIALVAARTDTEWWKTLTKQCCGLCLINGRLKFVKDTNKSNATFPSAILYFGERFDIFRHVFSEWGQIWIKCISENLENINED